MALLASQYVNWSAVGKICLVAVIGSVGIVLVFGILLYGVKLANAATSSGARVASYALSSVCGLICVGAFAIGIYAMAEKPASKAKKEVKTAKSAAVLAPGGSERKLTASVPSARPGSQGRIAYRSLPTDPATR
jgi:hypothetical protein